MIQIPTQQGLAFWSQRTALDGVDYQLDFAWNGREGAWYLSLSTLAGDPLVLGLKLVSNRPLLKRFRYVVGLPPGEIFVADPAGTTDAAGYTDLNSVVDLFYFEAADL